MTETYRVIRSEMGDPNARPLWAIQNTETGHIVEDCFYSKGAAFTYIVKYLAPLTPND